MSLRSVDTFRTNVQRASRLLYGGFVADRLRLTVDEIDRQLSTNDQWLTCQTADDFDEESFRFMPPDELRDLARAVAEVRDAATAIPEGVAAHSDQLHRARPHFKKVIELMGFDRYDDSEAFVCGKTIERRLAPVRPPHLSELRFRTGFDSTEDPALWVWAFVAETDEYDDDRFLARANVIEQVLKPISREVAPEGRAYFHFRTTSDLPEAQGVPA